MAERKKSVYRQRRLAEILHDYTNLGFMMVDDDIIDGEQAKTPQRYTDKVIAELKQWDDEP